MKSNAYYIKKRFKEILKKFSFLLSIFNGIDLQTSRAHIDRAEVSINS